MTEPFHDALADARHTAYHLEQRDVWILDSEEYRSSFDEFTAGRGADVDPDSELWREWSSTVRAATARGIEFRRLRIVSEPLTDYIRWEHAITSANVAVGEQVRWLPRSMCIDLLVVPVDFWVFDSASVLFGHFSGDGAVVRHELRTEPEIAKLTEDCFEAAWARAIPHEQYKPSA